MKHRLSRLLVALIAAVVLAVPVTASAVTSTADLTTQTVTDVAQALVGPGVTISNVTFTGQDSQAGTFVSDVATIGFPTGVILSSGAISNTIGPNVSDNITSAFSTAGDPDLDTLSGFPTQDAAVLEFDFTADADAVFFEYVFASDEYNEFVNSSFNDAFAFFVNGTNCAVIDDGVGLVPITVNTINNGNPYGDATSATNPAFYRNNDLDDGGGAIATEMDGLTIVLTCMAPVNPAPAINTMKLAIADASDPVLDSAVFLKEASLSTTPPTGDAKVTGGGKIGIGDGFGTFGTVVISDEQGLRGNLQLNDHETGDKFHGTTVSSLVVVDSTATWTGEGRFNGEDGFTFEVVVVDNRNGNSKKKGAADTISITVKDSSDVVVWSTSGALDVAKGNLRVH